jgi:hypothetical protein
VTVAHLAVAWAIAAGAAALLALAAWSWLAARRSGDRRDHRFAVDRLLLAIEAVAALNVAIGVLLYATGSRPMDQLHLLYGLAAVVTLPLGWWFGGRPGRDGSTTARRRRDAWVAVAAAVLLGVTLRLFLTG